VDTTTVRKSVPEVSTAHEDRPHACLGGFVFIGHLVEEEGEEAEIVEAILCRRCSADAR
jgi:hypothetical protein